MVNARKYTREEEAEANVFAAEFLMPEDEFREAAKTHKSIYTLSAIFGVSPAHALTRCVVLGIDDVKSSYGSYSD